MGFIAKLQIAYQRSIKGSYELRNFIAHDYEGIDLCIAEEVIRERLPLIAKDADEALFCDYDFLH